MATTQQVYDYLANLAATKPDAYKLIKRYSELHTAAANDPSGEVGRVTAATYAKQRAAVNYSDAEYESVKQAFQTQYPEEWKWTSENRDEAQGILGQGQPVFEALAATALAGGLFGGAAGGTTAATGTTGATATTAATTGGVTTADIAAGATVAGTADSLFTPTTTPVDTSIVNPPSDAYFDPATGTYTTPTGATTAPVSSQPFTMYDSITGQPLPASTSTPTTTPSGTLNTAGMFDALGNYVTSPSGIGTIANLGSGYLQGQSLQAAAENQSAAQIEAARLAAEAAKFRPVGVTTGFGTSQFGYDASGRLTSAGYELTPEMQRQRDLLISQSGGMLDQAMRSQRATAPMSQAAQSMFNMGQGYLGTSPQQQASQYMSEQQALLAAPRADQLAALQNKLAQQGRSGLAVGGNAGMMAANPDMAAYYNAIAQQDLGLASQATQGGMEYAKFGAGMVGLGGTTLQDMYKTQQSAYSPYTTALQGAQGIEQLGQGAMDIGTSLGQQVSTSGVQQGNFLTGGQQNAANYQTAAQSYNPWASMLGGVGKSMNQYGSQNNQWSY